MSNTEPESYSGDTGETEVYVFSFDLGLSVGRQSRLPSSCHSCCPLTPQRLLVAPERSGVFIFVGNLWTKTCQGFIKFVLEHKMALLRFVLRPVPGWLGSCEIPIGAGRGALRHPRFGAEPGELAVVTCAQL